MQVYVCPVVSYMYFIIKKRDEDQIKLATPDMFVPQESKNWTSDRRHNLDLRPIIRFLVEWQNYSC